VRTARLPDHATFILHFVIAATEPAWRVTTLQRDIFMLIVSCCFRSRLPARQCLHQSAICHSSRHLYGYSSIHLRYELFDDVSATLAYEMLYIGGGVGGGGVRGSGGKVMSPCRQRRPRYSAAIRFTSMSMFNYAFFMAPSFAARRRDAALRRPEMRLPPSITPSLHRRCLLLLRCP